jgi:DNA processing protein
VIVVSGLALGHDGLAHQGALNGGGITVAVLGTPINKIYPATNAGLAQEILKTGGAILSEYRPNAEKMHAGTFLARNRIISALADVVVIVEANIRSGTLNTAAHALSQGKEVMVVPGNIDSPSSQGCNELLKQGAEPLTKVEDILEKLNLTNSNVTKNAVSKLEPNEQIIYGLIKNGEKEGGTLLKKSKLETSEFNVAITMLELNGTIINLGANTFGLK